jgi:hypothetical protein
MKLIRQLGRVFFTLGSKSGDNKVSITVKPLKILIDGSNQAKMIRIKM